MSTTDLTAAAPTVERPPVSERQAPAGVPWGRVVLVCAILAVAGGIRWAQEQRVEAVLKKGLKAPFPLKSLPMVLGQWRVIDGREEELSPEVVEALRCVDYLKRHYVNEETGVAVDALVLYGPSTIAHIPEVCYPGSGFHLVDGPRVWPVSTPGGQGRFNSLLFSKSEGGIINREQVFYALRYDDRWTVELDFKKINRLPGLYKIQLTRRIGEHERLDNTSKAENNPCEAFLEAMLPELERRISEQPAASGR
jgi:uncharacterized protein DUF3485